MDELRKKAMHAAGRMSTAARQLVGGRDLNGFPIPSATIHTMSAKAEALEKAIDEYDRAILDLTEAENDER